MGIRGVPLYLCSAPAAETKIERGSLEKNWKGVSFPAYRSSFAKCCGALSATQGVFLCFEVKAQAINRICSFRPIGRAMGATPPPEVTVAARSTDKGSDSIYCRFRRGLAENYFPASGTCKALTQVDCFINDYVLCQWFANYWHRESKGPPTHDLRRGKARQGKAKQYRAGLGKARQGKAMHRARLRTTPDR